MTRRPAATREVPLERKVAFLKDPASYPECGESVEAVETHMAWVFLTGRYAFKMKKPFGYDGLDLSTLESRRRDCEEEVRLNRRLAPDAYLGTIPLTQEPDGSLKLDGEGTVVEWLVKMRRLPSDRTLDRAIRKGWASEADIRSLAAGLANFYRQLEPVKLAPRTYRRRIIAEFDASLAAVKKLGDTDRTDRMTRLRQRAFAFLDSHGELLDHRVRERRIVEGHGDLRPEHIYLDGAPRIIDCLEFSRDLRTLDPLDEIGYLSLECERLGAGWIGPLLVGSYGELTGDRPAEAILIFYMCLRAVVRLRIAIRHMAEPGRLTAAQWLARADEYLALAERNAAALPVDRDIRADASAPAARPANRRSGSA